jgi:hypothetical protein
MEATGISKEFLNRTPAAQQLRERMDKWDYMKVKIFAQQKKWSQTEETTHRVAGNICWLYIRQRTDNQNIQGIQKTNFPPNQ